MQFWLHITLCSQETCVQWLRLAPCDCSAQCHCNLLSINPSLDRSHKNAPSQLSNRALTRLGQQVPIITVVQWSTEAVLLLHANKYYQFDDQLAMALASCIPQWLCEGTNNWSLNQVYRRSALDYLQCMTVPRKMPTNYHVTAKMTELALQWWCYQLDWQWKQLL